MDGKLLLKVNQRAEGVDRIKAFVVFPMAALHLAIMLGRVRTNELMPDFQVGSGFLKKGGDVSFAVGKTVSKFKTVVSLDTFHMDTLAGIPLHHPFQEVSGGIGGLLRIGCQETELGEFVNGGILEQAKLRICDTAARECLHIHLNLFSRTSHLLVRFGCVSLFLLLLREHPQFAHDTKQALGPASIAALFQTVPQLHQTELGIAAAHISDQLQLRIGMLVWMAVRTPRLAARDSMLPFQRARRSRYKTGSCCTSDWHR